MAEKQLIVAVETTAAMGPYWDTLQMDYLEKIVRFVFLFIFQSKLGFDFSTFFLGV